MTNNLPLLIIGFCGGSFGSNGVGKTTAANFLVKKHNFHLCDLSNPVNESAKKLCKWDGKKDKNGLMILNQVCMKGRQINENYWFNISLASIPKNITKVVFDNVYFKNEADFIQNKGLIINIDRNGFEEIDLDFNFDHTISNDASLNDFENKIDNLINKLYNVNNAEK